MFTGVMPLEEFRREHQIEYDRLVQNGELSKYVFDSPQPIPLHILLYLMLALDLLVMVTNGFFVTCLEDDGQLDEYSVPWLGIR